MRTTKHSIIAAAIAALIASTPAVAENYKDMFLREVGPFVKKGGAVVILFHSDRSLPSVLATIAAASKSSNPNAIVNKQWVTDIAFRGYDNDRKCGLIIGRWAAGALESDWERVVLGKVGGLVNTIAFQYTKGGTLKSLIGTEGSEGDDLMELCM
jgi:hypothetical protein